MFGSVLCHALVIMKQQLAWIAPSALALVALGGVYAQQRRVAELEARLQAPRDPAPASAPSAEIAALMARVARLEQVTAWRASPPAPGSAPAAVAAPAPAAHPAPEIRQLREDVDALLTGEASATEQGKARLRAIIAETQQQQWADRQVRRDERLLEQLTESARLTTRQREDLRQALETERTQRRELLGKARAGEGGFQEIGPALQALRAQTDQKVRGFLDAEQYGQYTTSRSAGRGGRERGGGADRAPTAR